MYLISGRISLILISKKLKKKYGIEFGIGSFGFFLVKDIWIKRGETVIVVSLIAKYVFMKESIWNV